MIKIFGEQYQIPRKQIAFGQPGANYHFSGSSVQPYDWNQTDQSMNQKVGRKLKDLALRVSKLVCTDYNYVLCNNYLDQTKCIGYHQDDEKELGEFGIISGISLGQQREIYFKSNIDGQVIKIPLPSGKGPHNSLYCMFYPTNKYWKHSIPRSMKRIGQRISLTFRKIN
jgi:DNA oxidative demethylase